MLKKCHFIVVFLGIQTDSFLKLRLDFQYQGLTRHFSVFRRLFGKIASNFALSPDFR